jgi:RNA polymerase-binding transcription factor DksA
MKDVSIFKEEIEDKLKNIISELETIGTYDAENDDWKAVPEQEKSSSPDADVNSNADVVEEWNERRATLSDLEIEYRDLKRALGKIANGTYGICEVSGEPIEDKRLAAKPDARTCIAHMNDESQLPL